MTSLTRGLDRYKSTYFSTERDFDSHHGRSKTMTGRSLLIFSYVLLLYSQLSGPTQKIDDPSLQRLGAAKSSSSLKELFNSNSEDARGPLAFFRLYSPEQRVASDCLR
mmetsp:Transcript_6344/g.11129  ORF Transcript_6344/g.11129 Transcript_6344/m.11129 type:complete len:108 (-) Transcript_6344:15-338(-)